MKKIYFLFLFLFLSTYTFSQFIIDSIPVDSLGIIIIDKERVKKSEIDINLYVYYYAEANQNYYAGNYKKAYEVYSKLFDYDPYNYNYNYRMGLSLYKRGLYGESLYYLLYAAECINVNYLNSVYEIETPPIVFMYLGDIYCNQNKDYPMEFFYNKYLEYVKDENIKKNIESKIKDCRIPFWR
jgi:tetratricopeptide (TPR) repeat protein